MGDVLFLAGAVDVRGRRRHPSRHRVAAVFQAVASRRGEAKKAADEGGGESAAPARQLRVAGRRRDAGLRVLRLLPPPRGLRRQAPPPVSEISFFNFPLAQQQQQTVVARVRVVASIDAMPCHASPRADMHVRGADTTNRNRHVAGTAARCSGRTCSGRRRW